ncbi:MAG: hypothetical protein IJW73_03490 [Candidatus Gastranaerophilales bacterium]|nr:hypothetical protein [Candidatus Gastranaerophilales bacterium]
MEFNATFFVVFVSFIVFVFLMNMILYKPILEVMQKRKEFIDENYKSASENDETSSTISAEIDEKKDAAKSDARNKYNEIIDDFKNKKSELVQQAQQVAQVELDKSNCELLAVSNEMKENLKGSMTTLANEIVEKIIGYRSEIQDFDSNKVNEILYK